MIWLVVTKIIHLNFCMGKGDPKPDRVLLIKQLGRELAQYSYQKLTPKTIFKALDLFVFPNERP
jgi:hypothetical protein